MFNVYGPRQSIANPYQGVLAIFIGNVLRGEPITIHGDGLQTRDFVYIDDVVDAWMRVLDEPEAFGAVLNVGSGQETSVNDLADAVLGRFGESRATWDIRSRRLNWATSVAQRRTREPSSGSAGLAPRRSTRAWQLLWRGLEPNGAASRGTGSPTR